MAALTIDEKVTRLAEAALVSEDLPDRLNTQIAPGEIGLTGNASGSGFPWPCWYNICR
jgi:hypothetical protein